MYTTGTLSPYLSQKATVSVATHLPPKPLEISALVLKYAWQSIRNPKGQRQVLYYHPCAEMASEIKRQMCPVPPLPSENTF